MTVAVIDYGSGNLRSAAKALERAVAELGLDLAVVVTGDAERVAKAERIVLPGVGAFGDCMGGLSALPGMRDALEDAVLRRGRPFLGICIGMQLMADYGIEHGRRAGLGWIAGEVAPLAPDDPALKIPHMGWNQLDIAASVPPHPVLAGLGSGAHGYFVHGYAMRCDDLGHVLASVDYGGAMAAVVGRDNMIGTQFHPEKSQAVGLTLLRNFLSWRP
ncbi:MAG: imidazole glycerol phosphate synthase subunit HisH [Alphaproteobacteria bacterium]